MRASIATGNLDAVSERLRRLSARRIERLASRVANLAERNAEQYSGGKTPGTTYEATAETSGGDFPISVVLEANPRNDKADLLLRIAIGGRKSYQIRPRFKRALAWPANGRWPANSKSGKHVVWGGRPVTAPAIAPVLDGEFVNRALRNAIQRVKNDYR